MAAHLTKDPPTDVSKEQWMEEDVRLYLQICNSVDDEVIGLINHCEFVKELMDYLEFLYSRKGNVSQIFERVKVQKKPLKFSQISHLHLKLFFLSK